MTVHQNGEQMMQRSKTGKAMTKELLLRAVEHKLWCTKALFDGRVSINGCDAYFKEMGIGDINTHVFSGP